MANVIPSAGMRIGIGLSVWLRILDFRGRSTRTEVFCFFVVSLLAGIALSITLILAGWFDLNDALRRILPDPGLRAQLTAALAMLPFLPVFALTARRLHDIGLPGWPGPLLALVPAILAFQSDMHFRTGGTAPPLSGELQLLRAACLAAVYAILLWAPQRRTNRYGADPRLFRGPMEGDNGWLAPPSL